MRRPKSTGLGFVERKTCCILLFLLAIYLLSLPFSDTHLFHFFFFFFGFLLWILSFPGTFHPDILIFYVHLFFCFCFFWYFCFIIFFANLFFFYLFNRGMLVNLNKLKFSSSHLSSQPNKKFFRPSIFLPLTKHHETKTNISSIAHFFTSFLFSILLLFNILNQVNLIVSNFRLYCLM